MCEHIVHSSLSFVSRFSRLYKIIRVTSTICVNVIPCCTHHYYSFHSAPPRVWKIYIVLLLPFVLCWWNGVTASVYRGQELTVLLRDIIVRMCTWNRNSLTFTISHSIYMYIMFVTFPSVFLLTVIMYLFPPRCPFSPFIFIFFPSLSFFSQKEWERVFLCMYVYVRACLFLFYFR